MLRRVRYSVLKKQRNYYSGKKKRHTLKTQIVVDKASKLVICTYFSNGKKHDFNLFKDSKTHIRSDISIITDRGYVGIDKIHSASFFPIKRSKLCPLSRDDKSYNRFISIERVVNENIIGVLKRFRIISDVYRNRRKRFGLRFNLIAGIYNFETKYRF